MAKVDWIGLVVQVDPVLVGAVVRGQQHVEVVRVTG